MEIGLGVESNAVTGGDVENGHGAAIEGDVANESGAANEGAVVNEIGASIFPRAYPRSLLAPFSL